MKVSTKNYWPLLVLAGAACFASAQAADAVYQRTGNDAAIELSNIDEADSGQVAVTEEAAGAKAANAANAANAAPVAATPNRAARNKAGSADDATASAEACTERELADGLTPEACQKKKLAQSDGATPGATPNVASGYAAGSVGGFSYAASAGTENGGSSNTGNNTGAGGSTAGGSAAGGSTAGGTGSTGTGTGGSGTPTASVVTPRTDTGSTTASAAPSAATDPTLATNLQQYRQLMLQEAAAANINDNHAVSRRYLMTNRSTYQAAIGGVAP